METIDERAEREVTQEAAEKAKAELMLRQQAYLAVFSRDEKGNYSPKAQEILEDLSAFCRAHESCFSPDPRVQAMLEGRREVWLRIERHLELSSQKLWSLYEQRKF